jgi:hypothetical protein
MALAMALSSTAHADESGDVVRCDGNRLTLDVAGMPLRALLVEIGRQSGAQVRIDASGEETVSDAFNSIPLEEALRRLLGERSFAMVYTETVTGGRAAPVLRLKELRIYGGDGALVAAQAGRPTSAARPAAAGPTAAGPAADRAPQPTARRRTAGARGRTEPEAEAEQAGAAAAEPEATEADREQAARETEALTEEQIVEAGGEVEENGEAFPAAEPSHFTNPVAATVLDPTGLDAGDEWIDPEAARGGYGDAGIPQYELFEPQGTAPGIVDD